MKYFRKDIIKLKVVGSLYIHRLLHGKMKIIHTDVVTWSCRSATQLRHNTKVVIVRDVLEFMATVVNLQVGIRKL